MADDLIHCPSCNLRLRLPADLYGSEVECPQCHTRFTAPAPQAAAVVRPPPGREYDAVTPAAVDFGVEAAPPPVSGWFTAAAVCLLVTGLAGLGSSGYFAVTLLAIRTNPAEFDRQMEAQLNQNPNIKPADREKVREQIKEGKAWANDYGMPSLLGLIAQNLLTVLGAIAMLVRRAYWLAVLGSIAALNPVNLGCCLLFQVPFGIWALIMLMGSGRRYFR